MPEAPGTSSAPDPAAGGSGGESGAGNPDPGSGTPDPVIEPQAGGGSTQDGGSEGGDNDQIAKLRQEAANYRTQLRETQSKLKQFEDASKTDLEKAQGQVQDLNAKIAELEKRARKGVVLAVAGDVGIVKEARSDAADLLDWDQISDPSSEKEVEKALRNLVKEKPYLTGGVAGGADGGAGGRGNGASTSSMNDALRAAAGRR